MPSFLGGPTREARQAVNAKAFHLSVSSDINLNTSEEDPELDRWNAQDSGIGTMGQLIM
jgi:hypothetical protein